MLLHASYYMIRRMLRNYISLLILMATPLALITVLGLVAANATDPNLGIPAMDGIAYTMILCFQLYGGFYLLEFVKEDFYGSRKWRVHSLPSPPNRYIIAQFVSCTLFCALQGFAMVIFTHFVYGVNWGNWLGVLLLLVGISFFTQLVYLIIIFSTRNAKVADGLGVCYGLIATALAGVWGSMPDIYLVQLIATYVSPLSVGQNVMISLVTGQEIPRALVSVAVLVTLSLLMVLLARKMGRRELA